jgi:hypothetical protein
MFLDVWRQATSFEARSFRRAHYMNYDFGRIHETLRVTTAMAAGVTERPCL